MKKIEHWKKYYFCSGKILLILKAFLKAEIINK